MRKTVSLASSYRRQQLPASLMQRLALMQQLALAVQAGGRAHAPYRPRGARRGAPVIVLAWFSLGVIVSGAMGAGAIVGLRGLAAQATPGVGTPAVASWTYPGGDWDTVQLPVDSSQRARVPLAVEVTGSDADLEVVMHGLPAGVRPSRGVPVAEATWLLTRADLDGLHLTISEAAPDAFDVRIAVLSARGTPTAGSIVQVRLVYSVAPKQVAVGSGSDALPSTAAYDGISDGPGADAARPAPTPARTVAAQGGPSARARAPERRTSWWQMPPPAWSPFLVGQEPP